MAAVRAAAVLVLMISCLPSAVRGGTKLRPDNTRPPRNAMYMCMYVCMYVFIYIYIYIYRERER